MGLPYDLQKVYEQQREALQPTQHSEQIGIRHGVKILWLVLLLRQRLLRLSLPLSPTR